MLFSKLCVVAYLQSFSSWAQRQAHTTSLVWLLIAFHTLPYVPSPSCLTTLYLLICREVNEGTAQQHCNAIIADT